jgi:hypothetical protein
LNLGRSSADRQSGTFSSVTWTAQDLQVLSRAAAAHSDGNDVVELKLRLGATLSAPATIPHPDHLLNIFWDHVPAARLVLWLHAHCSHRLGSFDAAALSLLL